MPTVANRCSRLERHAGKLARAVLRGRGASNGPLLPDSLHWVLDIAFDEDHQRVRKDNGPANFAVLRHIALNLLKQEKTVRAGIKAKRLKAGWDEPYLLKVLFGLRN
jgi:predicted transposase YbfD/YdcC